MKIKYGIDLGTTNSGIAFINKGESIIVKNSLQKDTTPSCVGFTKKKGIRVGDIAYNQLAKDKLTAIQWVQIKSTTQHLWKKISPLKSYLLRF